MERNDDLKRRDNDILDMGDGNSCQYNPGRNYYRDKDIRNSERDFEEIRNNEEKERINRNLYKDIDDLTDM